MKDAANIAICKMLNVDPYNVSSLDLNLLPGTLPRVTITRLIFDEEIATITEKFDLVLRDDGVTKAGQ